MVDPDPLFGSFGKSANGRDASWGKTLTTLNSTKLIAEIQNSVASDIDEIFRLYQIATDFQKSKSLEHIWPEFDRDMVANEIRRRHQFKLVIDQNLACVWAIALNDPEIWGTKDTDPSVYIHRIATNPAFRGQNWVAHIVEWAKTYASTNKRKYVRLDTCGYNTKLIDHYTANGFVFKEVVKLSSTEALPAHYHNADVCLFELKV